MKIIESTFNKWKIEKKKINEYRYNDPQDEELSDGEEIMEITFFEKITVILTLNIFKTYRTSRVDIDYPEIFVNLPEVYQEKITEIVEKYTSELENSNSIDMYEEDCTDELKEELRKSNIVEKLPEIKYFSELSIGETFACGEDAYEKIDNANGKSYRTTKRFYPNTVVVIEDELED